MTRFGGPDSQSLPRVAYTFFIMRPRGLALRWCVAVASLAVLSSAAGAEPTQLGYGAMPGGLHVPTAETLPAGQVALSALAGYGYRSGLLGPTHSFLRGIGDLAVAYAPVAGLTLGLALDGHADKHYGIGQDQGFVGDPRLIVRLAKRLGTLHLGAQGTLWVPGKDAPSVATSAISVDARGLASVAAGRGTLGATVGFRLDHSVNSVDDLSRLSIQDQVSLGVSDYNAVLAGLAYRVPAGARAVLVAEASGDFFIGSGSPGPILRVGASAAIHLTPAVSALVFVEGAKVPGMDLSAVLAARITTIPYEPYVTFGVGLQARFGGLPNASSGVIITNVHPQVVPVIVYATIQGTVVDDTGKPIVGATVTVKTTNHTGTDVTDDAGAYAVEQLPIGQTVGEQNHIDDTAAEVSVAVDGRKPAMQTITLAQGLNPVPPLTLDPMLPPGQLMAVVRAGSSGKPVVGATVVIDPSGATATTGPDGTVAIDLPPGTYKARATAPGFKPQTLDVTIDPNGVAVKNFELPK